MAEKVFNYTLNGLVLQAVVHSDTGMVDITCVSGYCDINALYWSDGNTTADGGVQALSKANSALNMNGSGEVWDDSVIVSNAGLGTDGTGKAGYLTAGETHSFQIDFNTVTFDELETLGIRATSTSTPEGSIKAVADETHLSTEALTRWDFEETEVGGPGLDGGFDVINAPAGWTNLGGSLEIAEAPYGDIGMIAGQPTGFAAGEDQWLDTAASPGDVHVSTTVELDTGKTAQLSVSVASQSLEYQNNHYETPEDSLIQFKFNNEVVLQLTKADFDDPNVFKTFTVDVTGQDGTDTLEVVGLNPSEPPGTFTGFAVDYISLHEWIV